MKKLSSTSTMILSLTMLVIILSSCTGCKKDPIPTPADPTPTITITISNISQTSADVTIAATGQTSLSVTGPNFSKTATGTYTITGLTANTSYTVSGTASNATKSTNASQSFTTLAPALTAVISSTGTYDASTTAVDKVLLGRSVAKGLVLNVTTAGTAKIDVLGSLSNSNPAIAEYWINATDNTDLNAAASTLGATKVAITTSSFTINLNAGLNVICFKTAAYSGSITNGTAVGLKITASNNFTLANASYTADANSGNVATVLKQEHKTNNTVSVPANSGLTNVGWGIIQLTPFSDESATVYDGSLYPKILGLTLGTTADWSTGTTTGWSSLDFTNSRGINGQYFDLKQANPTSGSTIIFQNSNTTFSSNTLQFQLTTGLQITKSSLGNYAFMVLDLNVFNNASTQFGPASVSFVYKSVHFVGNPETWVYNGVRVQ